MYHTSSLFVPGGGSGESNKGDGLKTGSGSGGGKDLELIGGKGIGRAANSGCESGGSSKFDGLRFDTGSEVRTGSDSGGGAGGGNFLKSAGGVGEGAIGSNSCRSGAGPSDVVEKATGIYFLKLSSFSIEVSMVLVISLKLRLPGHSSGEVFAADGAGLRSGGGLMGGSARGLIRDGAGSNGAVGISCFYMPRAVKTSETRLQRL
jgi:hypothetical protein